MTSYTTRSGKTITTDAFGNTTITKVQNGKKVTKTYNVGNMTAGTLVGDASHVKIGSSAIHVHGRDPKLGSQPITEQRSHRVNPPVINSGGVRNQFNISGSVIGQMAIGNKGPTVFNNETKHFEAGAKNVDYNISGGNFTQANIGGKATYNNDKSTVGAYGGSGAAGGFSLEDLAYSNMEAEDKVLHILRKGISSEQFRQVLDKGHSIDTIEKALGKSGVTLDTMITSMLASDDMDVDDD